MVKSSFLRHLNETRQSSGENSSSTGVGTDALTPTGLDDGVWSSYDSILSTFARSQQESNLQPGLVSAVHDAEVNLYLKDAILPVFCNVERTKSNDPLEWWNTNAYKYPNIAPHVRKYLSCPATSVYSERVFSEAGDVYEAKRNLLIPETAGQLVFLKHNLRILNYKYLEEDY